MINFIEGEITLGATSILATSNHEDINTLTNEGLIEKREDGAGIYYYVETVADGMRFGIFIRFREEKIHWLILHWLDGPCTSQGWDGVSETALKDEYRLLSNFVQKSSGRPPDKKRNRQRTWGFKWGEVDVSYEQRDFVAAIFMKPR
jgi:hypothetical protein